jgi:hypothetical protein
MKKSADGRAAADEESVAPVTILDGLGRLIRVVPAEEFRRAHGGPERPTTDHGLRRRRAKTMGTEPGAIEGIVPR